MLCAGRGAGAAARVRLAPAARRLLQLPSLPLLPPFSTSFHRICYLAFLFTFRHRTLPLFQHAAFLSALFWPPAWRSRSCFARQLLTQKMALDRRVRGQLGAVDDWPEHLDARLLARLPPSPRSLASSPAPRSGGRRRGGWAWGSAGGRASQLCLRQTQPLAADTGRVVVFDSFPTLRRAERLRGGFRTRIRQRRGMCRELPSAWVST
eukprot:128659-Rhodomonas_salina.2